MNIYRILSPDFFIGKVLSTLRAIWQCGIFLFTSPRTNNFKLVGKIFKIIPKYSMVSPRRLISLYDLGKKVNDEEVLGDVVECGVWNGGSSSMIALGLKDAKKQVRRTFYLFDSFQGLPRPSLKDGVSENKNYFDGWAQGAIENVEKVHKRFNFDNIQFEIVPGYFNETLKRAKIKNIALLHIDADWYESVKAVLNEFFDKMADDGIIVFDDYHKWAGCRTALDEFILERNLTHWVLNSVDNNSVYVQLSSQKSMHGDCRI